MEEYEWYVKLMNFLDKRALQNRPLNLVERRQLDHCIEKYTEDELPQLIKDIADANDCGKCYGWNDIIAALRKLFVSGQRVKI